MQDKLNQLIEKHCETVKRSAEALGAILMRVEDGSMPPRAGIEEAEALAHQLKGSSGTIGFHQISRAAAALDDHLKTLCAAQDTVIIAGMGKAAALFVELAHAANTARPRSSALYAA